MAHERILVVEDEKDILELITFNLENSKYRVMGVMSGEQAVETARKEEPDLILLDLMLPGIDGMDVCRILKSDDRTKNIPLLMLTAKSEDSDIIAGLELGADDYLTKPFSPQILQARIRVILRRRQEKGINKTIRHIHNMTIDTARHEVKLEGESIALSATEFAILSFFSKNPGWVFSRNQIIDAIRGENYSVTERAVDVQILGLRKKLGNSGKLIETVRGIGYRLKDD